MDSDDDDDVVILGWWLKKMKRIKYWGHPLIRVCQHSTYVVARHLCSDPVKFKDFCRMSKPLFDRLVELVIPLIARKDTNWRLALSVEEKLTITVRYLATGSSFKCLAQFFMRGERTIGLVVAETTEAIWSCLQPQYMPVPDENMWKCIAQRYLELWSLPNCIGAIDGKHVRIQKFKHAGSAYFNYKGYHSVHIMACADADGCFTTIDVGDLGRNSDGVCSVLHV
ncbi:protein ANTAGONIST OF LIKE HETEROCHROMATIN PROTEIN 1-like [Homalodisca vitripennis]|uniref:protein ANTAGONIST OF LIKE HETEROCHROMATIN PROTEIN 1-like n=1 Tax=Homalodisca vitripennis TaxID=197043 RepID=UPI001EEB77D9|nr:protein ANTAGONIST OF LIKE HETEROCHROMATIN PROTEIN 1-like [Homalodisca vitripennis]